MTTYTVEPRGTQYAAVVRCDECQPPMVWDYGALPSAKAARAAGKHLVTLHRACYHPMRYAVYEAAVAALYATEEGEHGKPTAN